jgi:hypothetical protein
MINENKKFIFIHINKTAGRSISSALARMDNKGIKFNDKYHFHMPVFWLKSLVPNYDNLFSFCFVRNPYDWLYSNYAFITRELKILRRFNPDANNIPSFKEWLLNKNWHSTKRWAKQMKAVEPFPPIQIRQFSWWIDVNGECTVNYIGKFENLRDDFKVINQKIGVPYVELPHKNASKRKNDYREMYDQDMIDMVRETHKDSLKRFGYEF